MSSTEEWRDIYYFDKIKDEWIDFRGIYQVSNLGRVKSLGNDKTRKERILKVTPDKGGYLQVFLYKNGKRKTFKVHRLVATMFIPNPENKTFIDHINTIRDDNRVENLRWVTQKENNNNPLTLEKMSEAMKGKYKGENNPMYGRTGEKHPNSKKVICVTTGQIYDSSHEASRQTGVAYQSISACCKGKQKSAGKHPVTGEKLVWRYYEKEEE